MERDRRGENKRKRRRETRQATNGLGQWNGRAPLLWLEAAQACRFEHSIFAGRLGISEALLNSIFEVLNCRRLEEWLEEARMWVAGGRLLEGEDVATVAADVGVRSSAFEMAFKRYHGCHPEHFARRIREIDEQRLADFKKSWQEESLPQDWRPGSIFEAAIGALCKGLCPPAEERALNPGLPLLADLLHRVTAGQEAGRRERAKELLFELLHKPIARRLGAKLVQRHGYAPEEHLVWDAFVQALTDYFRRPERFDPNQRSLQHYLERAAWCNLLNLLASNQRRQARENESVAVRKFAPVAAASLRQAWESEALEETRFEPVDESPSPSEQIVADESLEELETSIRKFEKTLSEEELRVFQLLCAGETRAKMLAAAIGLSTAPLREQRRQIKRIRRRLMYKIWKRRPRT